MQNNPANKLKDFMWQFIMDKGAEGEYTCIKRECVHFDSYGYTEDSRAEKGDTLGGA